MIINDYNVATTEVIYILDYLPQDEVNKIPINFIKFLQEHSISDYNPQFDYSLGLDKLTLNRKTKALLAMIYRNYLCSEKEREEYDEILSQNEKKYKKQLNEIYDLEKILKNEDESNESDIEIQNSLIEQKESVFEKLKKFILKIFKKI